MAAPEWSTACPGWAAKLVAGESIIPPPIYPEEAEQALRIFKGLRVVDLPGKPTFEECSESWVFDFVAAIFGGYEAETGQQLIREYGLLISKKNTKSTIAAGIMLTALVLCWREEEEHLILAPTKEVADNSYKPAAAMVREDPELAALFHIQDYTRTITHRVNRNSLKVVAADTATVSGKKSGKVLVDELWIFGKVANAEAMFMEALGGQVSRDEGWVIYLTTQSDEPPAGAFKERLDYWRNVRDGVIEDRKTLGVLYEFPDEMLKAKAYLEPRNFYVTNPNIGRSVSGEWLEDQLHKVRAKTDGTFQQFLAKHLNVEIGLSLRNDRWPGADHWEKNGIVLSLEELLDRCEVVTFGADGGGLDDLLGAAAVGREVETGRWLAWTRAWAHRIVLERRKSEAPKLLDFQNDGDLVIVEDDSTQDIEDVADIVEQIEQSGLLDRIGVDPVGIGAIVDAIEARKIEHERIVGIPQGYKMAGAVKTTERKLAARQLLHGGPRLMAWCAGNARVVQSGNAVLITKQASGTAKIDPLMALFNAVALMAMNPKPRKKKYQMLFL